MKWSSVFLLSLFSQGKQAYVTPVIFGWVLILSVFLNDAVSIFFQFLLGCILVIYQQVHMVQEDQWDSFFDYCQNNGTSLLAYITAKTIALAIITILPMLIVTALSGVSVLWIMLLGIEWAVLAYFTATLKSLDKNIAFTQVFLVGLPLITAPIVFLNDYALAGNISTLYFFGGANLLFVGSITGVLAGFSKTPLF